jgi:hypothetical protein
MKLEYLNIPNPILTCTLDISDELSKKCIERIYDIGDQMNKKTNLKADMSSYHLHLKDKTFVPILKKVTDIVYTEYPFEYFVNTDYYKKSDFFIQVQAFWSGVYKKNDYAIRHNHVGTYISFCLYLQADEYSSPIRFDHADFEIKPEKNKLIIFPAHVDHSVSKQSRMGVDRVILAGNIMLPLKDPNA